MASSNFDPNSAIITSERLARFVFYREHIRIDGTLKPDAFIPHPYTDTSVTRHDNLQERKIWVRGNNVARQTHRRLIGRGDARASAYLDQGLQIKPAPTKCNPQHVNVHNWPTDKPAQKNRAQRITKASVFKPSIEISDAQAVSQVGEFAIVQGVVAEIVTTHKGNVLFNFGLMHPDQTFTAWIQTGASFLNDPVFSSFQGKTVRVIGKIELFKAKAEIRVSSRLQILDSD
jgi:hypothetical protein